MRFIKVNFPADKTDAVISLVSEAAPIDWSMDSGYGRYEKAAGAALLLGLNVVCAILSAQLVFVWKGVRPRTWLSQKKANRAVKVNLAIWIILLIALAAISVQLKIWV